VDIEKELDLTYHPSPESLVEVCDVISLHNPLYPSTENMFDDKMFALVKRGAYLINCARGKLCDRDAVVRALQTGRLAGYAGDVWFPQPAPVDHPWRAMVNQGMTPHMSGTSLSAQARYAAGTLEILQSFFDARPIRREYLIVDRGELAGTGAASYKLS
jgi:formate dehydrogenase